MNENRDYKSHYIEDRERPAEYRVGDRQPTVSGCVGFRQSGVAKNSIEAPSFSFNAAATTPQRVPYFSEDWLLPLTGY